MPKPSKTIGELNGKWAFIFKLTQILWTILLPVLLFVLLNWMPWVTKQTILNEQFRSQEEDRKAALRMELKLAIQEALTSARLAPKPTPTGP